ncbi:MAG: response regulator [Ignavibacteriales bacterium]|nr:response regulator [Ignavibacteriales bacterium]
MSEEEKRTISVMIVDDHQIVRDGLRLAFEEAEDIVIVGEAGDGVEAVEKTRELKPDVVALDIDMPRMNGISAAREIRKFDTNTRILMLTMHENEAFVFDAATAGINGYLFKMAGMTEIIEAVRAAYVGNEVFSPKFFEIFSRHLVDHVEDEDGEVYLTKREREVVKLVAQGLTSKQIADKLFISFYTVKNHRKNIMQKLDLHSMNELADYAIEKGIYRPGVDDARSGDA